MRKSEFNINRLVRPNVAQMKPYSSARDEFQNFNKSMVFLDANENPFENQINRYPDPKQIKLKQMIAEKRNIPLANTLLGNGSDEVVDLIFRTFCEPKKDNIITLPPTYGMYSVLSNLNEIENREVVLNACFQPNLEEIFSAIDARTKLIFICSPNNPTGNLIDSNLILELLENFDGLVVLDEAYIDFANEKSWTSRLPHFPNLIITQTLSKAYGMAGIRVGICFASEAIINLLNKIKPPYNISELTQGTAISKLQNLNRIKAEINAITEQRTQLFKDFSQIKFIEKVYPSQGNFILLKVDDAEKRYIQLLNKGIVVRNRSIQPLCENTLRITVGTPSENRNLIETLKNLP
ncbi:histidinol-phosphate transaminase [Aequorivita sp. SDUM287046]|uniref:Histidinol-phosphate aminotransferase n=1 Tax=Aequorivita aurantiaca TaxID=3053356 RepID=A0ABT8DEB5_9FLAO|nr:histidinol-phosphate transaminase [Aequorivita aurantiaca]MDN3723468.1 histidinol-phosphate transaminase [Aequorivita aurantiaca]